MHKDQEKVVITELRHICEDDHATKPPEEEAGLQATSTDVKLPYTSGRQAVQASRAEGANERKINQSRADKFGLSFKILIDISSRHFDNEEPTKTIRGHASDIYDDDDEAEEEEVEDTEDDYDYDDEDDDDDDDDDEA
ncbi:unnamed protein product [Schistocephalus solidus]|uniref:Uncharacterized protein n=1 Tax=Schistocephalus solidus TaxID=70667 RepID=A0A183T465_SCHSO|nr:unnamed protein product [Schistocephalus solidus]